MTSTGGNSSICTCQQSVHTAIAKGKLGSLAKSPGPGKWLPLGWSLRSRNLWRCGPRQFMQFVFFMGKGKLSERTNGLTFSSTPPVTRFLHTLRQVHGRLPSNFITQPRDAGDDACWLCSLDRDRAERDEFQRVKVIGDHRNQIAYRGWLTGRNVHWSLHLARQQSSECVARIGHVQEIPQPQTFIEWQRLPCHQSENDLRYQAL